VSAATHEQLARVQSILLHLDARQKHAHDNRRRAPRVIVQMPLAVVVLGVVNPAPVQIYSRNLSVSGIGFVSRRLFKPAERIVVYLRAEKLPSKLLLARITFGRYAGGGYYEMGAEFLESVPDKGHTRIPDHWLLSGGTAPVPAKK
jgi:hypothetical protein